MHRRIWFSTTTTAAAITATADGTAAPAAAADILAVILQITESNNCKEYK